VGLISQKRCIPVTFFAALLLPILLYYCCRFCCTAVTIFAAFLDAGYTGVIPFDIFSFPLFGFNDYHRNTCSTDTKITFLP
ncbi:MAG: hypothetical protein IKG90_06550, partial [Bacteroidales bacterium]|nr:hypothetical protein [Bacteroidales bacterium]